MRRKDALLTVTKPLPNGAATTVSDPIQLGKGIKLANGEFQVTIPALTTGQLPDTQTVTYTLESCAVVGFGSNVQSYSINALQTGAGAAGAVAQSHRFKPPSTGLEFWRVKAVKTGAADASAKSVELAWVS